MDINHENWTKKLNKFFITRIVKVYFTNKHLITFDNFPSTILSLETTFKKLHIVKIIEDKNRPKREVKYIFGKLKRKRELEMTIK